MKQYEDYYVPPKTIATAIYNHLESRKVKVDRNRGLKSDVNISGWGTGGVWVKVEKTHEKE